MRLSAPVWLLLGVTIYVLGDGARTLMPALRPDGRACQPDNEVRAFQAEALWSWRR